MLAAGEAYVECWLLWVLLDGSCEAELPQAVQILAALGDTSLLALACRINLAFPVEACVHPLTHAHGLALCAALARVNDGFDETGGSEAVAFLEVPMSS